MEKATNNKEVDEDIAAKVMEDYGEIASLMKELETSVQSYSQTLERVIGVAPSVKCLTKMWQGQVQSLEARLGDNKEKATDDQGQQKVAADVTDSVSTTDDPLVFV